MANNNIDPFTEAELQFLKKFDESRLRAQARFPLITALTATFGFVLLLDGFQKIIDKIPLLANNPIVLVFCGLAILAVTGTVYKKLN
jgi:hypothetical protein